eukprot:1183208-Prorocentrum_minimum.AAC.5
MRLQICDGYGLIVGMFIVVTVHLCKRLRSEFLRWRSGFQFLGGDPPAGGPGKEAAQRQGSVFLASASHTLYCNSNCTS